MVFGSNANVVCGRGFFPRELMEKAEDIKWSISEGPGGVQPLVTITFSLRRPMEEAPFSAMGRYHPRGWESPRKSDALGAPCTWQYRGGVSRHPTESGTLPRAMDSVKKGRFPDGTKYRWSEARKRARKEERALEGALNSRASAGRGGRTRVDASRPSGSGHNGHYMQPHKKQRTEKRRNSMENGNEKLGFDECIRRGSKWGEPMSPSWGWNRRNEGGKKKELQKDGEGTVRIEEDSDEELPCGRFMKHEETGLAVVPKDIVMKISEDLDAKSRLCLALSSGSMMDKWGGKEDIRGLQNEAKKQVEKEEEDWKFDKEMAVTEAYERRMEKAVKHYTEHNHEKKEYGVSYKSVGNLFKVNWRELRDEFEDQWDDIVDWGSD